MPPKNPPKIIPQDSPSGNLCGKVLISGWPRFGSVRLRFGDGTVRAVPVFGSGGSSKEGVTSEPIFGKGMRRSTFH